MHMYISFWKSRFVPWLDFDVGKCPHGYHQLPSIEKILEIINVQHLANSRDNLSKSMVIRSGTPPM